MSIEYMIASFLSFLHFKTECRRGLCSDLRRVKNFFLTINLTVLPWNYQSG